MARITTRDPVGRKAFILLVIVVTAVAFVLLGNPAWLTPWTIAVPVLALLFYFGVGRGLPKGKTWEVHQALTAITWSVGYVVAIHTVWYRGLGFTMLDWSHLAFHVDGAFLASIIVVLGTIFPFWLDRFLRRANRR